MPEGPSIVILTQAIEELNLKGEKIAFAEGTAAIDMERLTGQKVTDFRSWGKHFLVCFETFTLRIHFMLFGSYLINERKKNLARLSLQFEKAELNFYACSVKILEQHAAELYGWDNDIMSEEWNSEKALEKLKNAPSMLVCDALLDQNIFSGSGNIIKNEVLFRINVHPLSHLGAIPNAKLEEMVRETRAYSFDFLAWKKENVLKKQWLAHTKKICPHCLAPFHKEYLGKTKRRSYYCVNCQALHST